MKRFIAFMTAAAAALSFALTAYAAQTEGGTTADSVIGTYSDGTMRVGTGETDSYAVLSFYDNGTLVYSAAAAPADDGYTFNVPEEYIDFDARICFMDDGIIMPFFNEKEPAQTETPQPTSQPSETPDDEETAGPTETATPKPVNTPYPDAYESERDADNAPAVIKDVNKTVIDGEEFDMITMLYAGNEITVSAKDTVTIVSAPDAASYLIGSGADALRDGDVIHFTADLQGKLRSIELIYRPDFDNYVTSGSAYGKNFEQLISASGVVANQSGWRVASYGGSIGSGQLYAFGVPIETDQGFVTLANADGTRMDITVNPNAMVYTVNKNTRGDRSEFSGNGGAMVTRTFVPSSCYDEDLNVTSWEESGDISYALVRIIDGVATDIFVFVS